MVGTSNLYTRVQLTRQGFGERVAAVLGALRGTVHTLKGGNSIVSASFRPEYCSCFRVFSSLSLNLVVANNETCVSIDCSCLVS